MCCVSACVTGQAAKPGLHFEFLKYDFGPCFVTPAGQVPTAETALLKITNRDSGTALSLDCDFDASRCLWVECPSCTIAPGDSISVPINFAPREVKEYAFSLPFVVNGSYTVKLPVIGEGCPARLELANPSQRHVQFGTVSAGSTLSKSVRVVNRSRRPLTLALGQEHRKLGGVGCLTDACVSYSPVEAVTLAPKQGLNIELTFAPAVRLPAFSESLMVRYGAASEYRVLAVVSGQSTGMSIALEQSAMPFGTVCLGSSKTQRLQLNNTGKSTDMKENLKRYSVMFKL